MGPSSSSRGDDDDPAPPHRLRREGNDPKSSGGLRRQQPEDATAVCFSRSPQSAPKPEQRDLIDQAAAMLGESRSDFMLAAACERAQSVLLNQVYFRLDEVRFNDFIRFLDAPPAPNRGLERLMAVKAPWAAPAARKAPR